MFCTNCGKEIENGNFCPYCGTPAAKRQDPIRMEDESVKMMPAAQSREDLKKEKHFVPVRTDPALPQDMFLDRDGYIRWSIPERDKTKYYFMNETRVGFVEFYPSKEQTAGGLLKDAFKLAAGIAVISSETYHSSDLPWDLSDYEGGIGGYLDFDFRLVKKMKGNRRKNKIVLTEDLLLKFEVETNPEHYSFVLDYMLRHMPDVIVQEA